MSATKPRGWALLSPYILNQDISLPFWAAKTRTCWSSQIDWEFPRWARQCFVPPDLQKKIQIGFPTHTHSHFHTHDAFHKWLCARDWKSLFVINPFTYKLRTASTPRPHTRWRPNKDFPHQCPQAPPQCIIESKALHLMVKQELQILQTVRLVGVLNDYLDDPITGM